MGRNRVDHFCRRHCPCLCKSFTITDNKVHICTIQRYTMYVRLGSLLSTSLSYGILWTLAVVLCCGSAGIRIYVVFLYSPYTVS
ncbi:hypothetical protein PM082_001811 [Marasmius tenuissimus]|nr:hypothetical protein PM082_001811 [Marasmius tenuissimus]